MPMDQNHSTATELQRRQKAAEASLLNLGITEAYLLYEQCRFCCG